MYIFSLYLHCTYNYIQTLYGPGIISGKNKLYCQVGDFMPASFKKPLSFWVTLNRGGLGVSSTSTEAGTFKVNCFADVWDPNLTKRACERLVKPPRMISGFLFCPKTGDRLHSAVRNYTRWWQLKDFLFSTITWGR